MTTLREAAQQALEALEHYRSGEDYQPTPASDAITALREALAQPEPEPVAWMIYTLDGASVCVTDSPSDFTSEYRALPIYATPPQRKPLTDEELVDIVGNCAADSGGWFRYHAFARAIEQAHGIGEKE